MKIFVSFALLFSIIFLNSCGAGDLIVSSAGIVGKPTEIPMPVDFFQAEPCENSITLRWRSAAKKTEGGSLGNLIGDMFNDIIYAGVWDPDGYEIWRRAPDANENWRLVGVVLADSADGTYPEGLIDIGINDLIGDVRLTYSFTDKDVEPLVVYEYRIAAYNGAGPSRRTSLMPTPYVRTLFRAVHHSFSYSQNVVGGARVVELSWSWSGVSSADENLISFVIERGYPIPIGNVDPNNPFAIPVPFVVWREVAELRLRDLSRTIPTWTDTDLNILSVNSHLSHLTPEQRGSWNLKPTIRYRIKSRHSDPNIGDSRWSYSLHSDFDAWGL